MRFLRWIFILSLAFVIRSDLTAQPNPHTLGTIQVIVAQNLQAGGPADGSLVAFQISPMPAVSNGCATTTHFAFSSQTVLERENRDNFNNTLLLAKATGRSVLVEYSASAYCDSGFIGVRRIDLQ